MNRSYLASALILASCVNLVFLYVNSLMTIAPGVTVVNVQALYLGLINWHTKLAVVLQVAAILVLLVRRRAKVAPPAAGVQAEGKGAGI